MEAEHLTADELRDKTGIDPLLLAIVSALAAIESRAAVAAGEESDEALAA